MYEYRTTNCWGVTLPETLTPPEPGFRLRDFRMITTMESETHMVADRYSSISGPAISGSINIPYTQSVTRTHNIQWMILWERYTEQEN